MSNDFTLATQDSSYILKFSPPMQLSFLGGIVVMHADGRIEVSPDVTADEAARQFLECLRTAFPQWVESLRNVPR